MFLRRFSNVGFLCLALILSPGLLAGEENKEDEKPMSSGTFSGLRFRSIGPALMSGRICDFAVHP